MPRRSTGWEDRDDAQDHQRLRRILHAGGRSGRRAIRARDLAGHGAGDALGRATRSRRCSADRRATARGRAGARSPHEPHRARAGVRQPAASPPGHHTFGYVLEGTYEFAIDRREPRLLKAGDTFYEPPTAVHSTSRNPSTDQRLKFLVFMVADQKNPTTVPD